MPSSVVLRMQAFSDAIFYQDYSKSAFLLRDILLEFYSFRDFRDESSYETMLLTMLLFLEGRYRPATERESGDGYFDILLENTTGDSPHLLIEIKMAKSGEDLKDSAARAIAQIKGREYYHGLRGEVILYGVAFRGKEPYMESERLIL